MTAVLIWLAVPILGRQPVPFLGLLQPVPKTVPVPIMVRQPVPILVRQPVPILVLKPSMNHQ